MPAWYWLITVAATCGTLLNVFKRRECFVIWCGTNTIWIIINWRQGCPAQAVQYGVNLLFAIGGLIAWSRSSNDEDG